MNESIIEIIEIAMENKLCLNEKKLTRLLNKNFTVVKDTIEDKGEDLADILFTIGPFCKEIDAVMHGVKHSLIYKNAAELLHLLFTKLSVDISKEECFIWFHFRGLGKFRTKEEKAFKELKSEWGMHKDYAMDMSDFEVALRELKNHGILNLRRGAITLPESCVFRFKY
jgi:hypothetical protein